MGWATLPPGSTFGPRILKDYEFLWMIEGESVADWDGRRYDLPPGSLSLVRADTRDAYRWDPRRNTQAVYLHFYFKPRPKGLPPEKDWPPVRVLPEGDILRPLIRYVLWLLDGRTPRRVALANGAMRLLLAAYLSGDFQMRGEVATNLPPPVAKAIRLAHERLHAGRRPPALGELAREACVSAGHLCRLFRVWLGCGPMEAMRRLRLDRAATLLATSNLPVKEVAALTGFPNPFHFSKRFRQNFGIPPRAYRAKAAMGAVVPSTRLLARRTVKLKG